MGKVINFVKSSKSLRGLLKVLEVTFSDQMRAMDGLIEKAQEEKGGNNNFLVTGEIEDQEANIIKEKTGLDVQGYSHAISSGAINHMFRRHGEWDEERQRGEFREGSQPITGQDIRLIPLIISDPDEIKTLPDYPDGIIYTKDVEGVIYYVEEVQQSRKRGNRLVAKTMWKHKRRAATRGLVPPKEPLAETSETNRALSQPEDSMVPNDDDDKQLLDAADADIHLKTKEVFKLAGHMTFQGLPISIENKKGSFRKGVDKDGHKWKVHMHSAYGYITGTLSPDDMEGIDVYIGDDRKAKHAYIVKQHKIEDVKGWGGEYCPDCSEHSTDCACSQYFDEDKVMLGYSSKQAAIEAYNKQYDSPLFLGPVSTMLLGDFRELMLNGKGKPTAIPYHLAPTEFLTDSVVGYPRHAIEQAASSAELFNIFDQLIKAVPEEPKPTPTLLESIADRTGPALVRYIAEQKGRQD